MSYDYLLYDNRTLGLGGRDWAVKAATGRLRGDQEATQKFVEYCRHFFDSRLGLPSNFGTALGGVPLRGGYLLCVTLENQDLHQRPSCAVVGIHCPQAAALKKLLTEGDPLLSAKKTSDSAPRNLQLTGAPLVANGVPPKDNMRPGLYPFQQGSSPENVAKILLKHADKGARLPSILGITLWNGNRSQLLRAYEFVFCQGLPAREAHPVERARQDMSGKGASKEAISWPILVAAFCFAFVALIYGLRSHIPGMAPDTPSTRAINKSTETQEDVDHTSSSPEGTTTPVTTAGPAAKEQSNELALDPPEDFLKHFEELLHRIESASPEKLKKTREWEALTTVEVRGEFRDRQQKMIELLKTKLPDFKNAVDKADFKYFFRGEMLAWSASKKTKEIREKISKIPLPEGCTLLYSSFALWTKEPNSTTGEWCNLVEEFSKVSGTTSITGASTNE